MSDDAAFEELLQFLKRQRGFDFTGYKRTSLRRRVTKRMESVGVDTFPDYVAHLEVQPDEFTELFNTLLINVTGFFRDTAAWEYLDEEVLPRLLERLGDQRELRIWSAGCASGEEAYSVAMLLVRALGEQDFRERVKIYATDIDEDALTTARHAAYSPRAVEPVEAQLLERCFERTDQHYAFRRDLRRSLIFGRNDLVQDAPISRIDLLLCRNVLMYFTAETQARILSRFNFALRDTGRLFLGRSEMLLTHGGLFKPEQMKCRVFTKVRQNGLRERLTFAGNGDPPPMTTHGQRLRDFALDRSPVAQVVVDRAGMLAATSQRARMLFGLGESDLGRPLRDLELSYRPVELRGPIEEAYAERRAVRIGQVAWVDHPGNERRLEVEVLPILADENGALGATITYADVTEHVQLRDELERSKRELEGAYEELQSTVEELETTNEELQSTNEELETTNEELQSANEELETTNEELQSTNEELQTMNDVLRERTAELDSVNASLETILTSLGVGVAVIDPEQVVRVWNAHSEELWGMRPDEATGRSLYSLDIGLPVDRLTVVLREALEGNRPDAIELDATNRRGRAVTCRVTAVPLSSDGDEVRGAILLMEAAPV